LEEKTAVRRLEQKIAGNSVCRFDWPAIGKLASLAGLTAAIAPADPAFCGKKKDNGQVWLGFHPSRQNLHLPGALLVS